MFPLSAFAKLLAISSLLSNPLIAGSDSEKNRGPDQTSLQSHLERCEKALRSSPLLTVKYRMRSGSRACDGSTISTGQVCFLRLPGIPEIFFMKDCDSTDGTLILQVSNYQIVCIHRAKPGSLYFALHLGRCHFDYKCVEKFWADNSRHLSVSLDLGDFRCCYDNGKILIYDLSSLGFIGSQAFESGLFRGPVGVLFGMRAKQAQSQYDIRLTKEDKHYIYIEAFPRTSEDKLCFSRAQVVIEKETFLPCRLGLAGSFRDASTFDFTKVNVLP
ncbi:MAG: hypothetical protein ACJ8FY_21775 [Gemmataceae bacterium]